MPIPVACGGCGKRFNAPDSGAGKKARCPQCQEIIQIPLPEEPEIEEEFRLQEDPFAQPTPSRSLPSPPSTPRPPQAPAQRPQLQRPSSPIPFPQRQQRQAPQSQRPPIPSPQRQPANPFVTQQQPVQPALPTPLPADPQSPKNWVPATRSSVPDWLRHLHWLLALAMIPLAFSILLPGSSEDIEKRFVDTVAELEEQSPEFSALGEDATEEELFNLFPGHRIKGAFLARDTSLHWLFALVSAAAFMTFFCFLASDKCAEPLHLLGLGLFTATIGIALLLFVQALSGLGFIRVRGILGFVLLILALIGLSYRLALDPDVGIIGSFFGFTLGVGLCEELCKAGPLLFYYRTPNQQSWRGAFLWGMASGAGFGVSEGVTYSSDYYNGISGPGIYLVRFISCVALHAIWAGSIGISINQRRDWLNREDEWVEYCLTVLVVLAVPMVLHGLYDTLLKKDLDFCALLVAGASFGYLAWQISNLRQSDDEDERARFVSNYIRAKLSGSN